MIKVLTCILFVVVVVVVVSGHPFAKEEGRWIHKTLTGSPNFKALHVEALAKSVVPQKPKSPGGGVRVENCGIAPLAREDDQKITGGTEATPHEFPWQVALFIWIHFSMSFCSGTVISEEWVLTTAHCIDGALMTVIVLGAHDVASNYEPSQLLLNSNKFFVHERYSSELLINDIGLIKLPTPLTFNDYIQPICLPTGDDLGHGVIVTISGWGKIHENSLWITDMLRKVDVPTITNEECYKAYDYPIYSGIICSNSTGPKGICTGDAGGPLNYVVNGVTETRGIASFSSATGCESGLPNGFTRVSHYLGWIQKITGIVV